MALTINSNQVKLYHEETDKHNSFYTNWNAGMYIPLELNPEDLAIGHSLAMITEIAIDDKNTNVNLYYQPILYESTNNSLTDTDKPTEYYQIRCNAVLLENTTYSAPLVTGATNPELKKNLYVSYFFYRDNGTDELKIVIYQYFHNIMDIGIQFQSANFYENELKLIRSSYLDINDLILNSNSAYKNGAIWTAFCFIENSDDLSDTIAVINQVGTGLKFYGLKSDGTALASKDLVDFTFYVDSVDTLGKLSLVKDTTINIDFQSIDLSDLTYMALAVIRTTTANNVDWRQDVQWSRIQLDLPATWETGDDLQSIFSAYSFFGSTFSATIDHTKLVNGENYRFIFLHCRGTVGNVANWDQCSNISNSITTDYEIPANTNAFNYHSFIRDYYNSYLGNEAWVVPEERIESALRLEYQYNKLYLALLDRFGNTAATNYLENYLTKVTCEIYSDDFNGSDYTRNIYQRDSVSWNGLNYVGSNKITNTSSISTSREFRYDIRIRYEDNLNCLESWIGDILLSTKEATQNWSNKTLYLRWIFNFDFQSLGVNTVEDWIYEQKLVVLDYGVNGETLSSIIAKINGNIVNAAVLCSDNQLCLESHVDDLNSGWKSIINLHQPNSSINNLSESDMDSGNGALEELYDDRLNNKDHYTLNAGVDNEKDFCIDLTENTTEAIQRISCIAKYKCIGSNYDINVDYLGGYVCDVRLWGDSSIIKLWIVTPLDQYNNQNGYNYYIQLVDEIFISDYINEDNGISMTYNGYTGKGYYINISMQYEDCGGINTSDFKLFVFIADDYYGTCIIPKPVLPYTDYAIIDNDGHLIIQTNHAGISYTIDAFGHLILTAFFPEDVSKYFIDTDGRLKYNL